MDSVRLKYIEPILQSRKSVILLLLAAIGLGFFTGASLRFSDETDYHLLADSLVEGDGYRDPEGEWTAFRPPGYPFFLRAVYSLWHNPLLVTSIQALLLAGSGVLMVRLMQRENGVLLGLPGWMILSYPVLLYTSTTLYPQTLGGFLLLMILTLLSPPDALWKCSLAGLALGFLILCMPAFMLTAPFLALCLWLSSSSPFPRRLLKIAILAGCSLLIVAPWTYRNYRVFDTLVPVSTNSGLNLYFGNSPHTRPSSGATINRSHLQPLLEDMNEVERDHFYRDLALGWVREYPVEALRLYAGKVLHYFHFRNHFATVSENNIFYDIILFFTWIPLLLLFLIRPFYHKRFPFSLLERTIWILVISNVFLSALFFTRIRFRLPFDLLMILANAIFVDRVFGERSSKIGDS